MFHRIVVPLDGSKLAEAALPAAEEFARLANAPIVLLRVVDFTRLEQYGPYGLALEYASVEPVLAAERAEAVKYLEEVCSRLGAKGLSVTFAVRSGPVAREIVAATRPGDVIVMASHGRGGLSRWLLGSVAEDVVRHALVPVMIVRADAMAGAGDHASAGDASRLR
jgi:nucleotide-binding universal stress UspA family protein